MISCRQLADDLASGRTRELGWFGRLKLRLHALLCPPCKLYAEQLSAIGEAARQAADERQPCEEEMAVMRARCLERLRGLRTGAKRTDRAGGDAGDRDSG